jgi:hypothetical protein
MLEDDMLMRVRQRVIRTGEENTAVFACQKERLNGREVEKLTAYFPADPFADRFCSHGFDPKAHLTLPGTRFWARLYWFDPDTGRLVQRKCGCKRPGWEIRIDYPAPESVPKELFTFEVPHGAVLEVSDPELGRSLRSAGQKEPPS